MPRAFQAYKPEGSFIPQLPTINETNQPTRDEHGAQEDGEGKRTERWPDQPLWEDVPGLLQPWDRVVAQACGLSLASGPMPTGLSSTNCVQGMPVAPLPYAA